MERFRPLSLFQPSNFVAAIESRNDGQKDERPQHLFGALMTVPHTQIARVLAVLGFDYIFVDTLHAATNAEKLVDIIQTINFASEGKTCALVRIPTPESELLAYALDAGAAGIIFPQVDTAAQATAAVQQVRYAYGGGNRSLSPVALLDGITNIAPPGWTAETIADRNVAIICQIESVLGIENVDAIARTAGINGLMLGAGDLRASLGLPSRNPPGQGEDPKFNAAVAKLVAAAKNQGLPLMAPAFRLNPETKDFLRDFKMLVTSVDILGMVKTHRQELAQMKEGMLGSQSGGQNEPNAQGGTPDNQDAHTGAQDDHHAHNSTHNGCTDLNGTHNGHDDLIGAGNGNGRRDLKKIQNDRNGLVGTENEYIIHSGIPNDNHNFQVTQNGHNDDHRVRQAVAHQPTVEVAL